MPAGKIHRLSCGLLIAICCLLIVFQAHGQTTVPVAGALMSDPAGNLDSADGLIIDSIVIENRNVYDTRLSGYDNFLFRTANRLHTVTRASVIRRELLFVVGGSFSTELADELARNLRARYELYDAWVETEMLGNGHLLVRVVTIDLWSLLVRVNITREGNRTNYRLGAEERNLLGCNQFVSVDYVVQEDDDNYFASQFRDNRILGRPLRLKLDYNNNPTAWIRFFSLNRPYYDLRQRFAFGIGYAERGGRTDVYDDGTRIAESSSEGNWVSASLGYRYGSYKRKLDLAFIYDYVSETTFDRRVFNLEDTSRVNFPEDSTYHQCQLSVGFWNLGFARAVRINGFGYTEDFTLGQSIKVGAGRAFRPGFADYLYDRVEMSGSHAAQIGSNLILAAYQRVYWLRGDRNFRRLSRFSVHYYNNRLQYLTLAARIVYSSDWRYDGSDPLILGGTNGMRGYDKFYQSGNRRAVANLEGRFFSGVELLSVRFGGVMFVDIGRSWKDGDPVKFSHFSSSLGIGLRISLEKSSKGQVIRIDLSRGQDDTWQFTIGNGQFF
jgi:hypothetical protein